VAAVPKRAPVLTLFALSGAAALVYQVIWARQLALVLGNTTISVSIVLAAFMLGLGLGAALAGRRWMSAANPLRVYALVEGAIGVYALAFTPLDARGRVAVPALFAEDASLPVLIAARSLAALALLLVPTTLMGTTLPLDQYLHRLEVRREDWNAGRLCAANTLGAAFGSAATASC
jgi:spermidine synthase